MRQTPLVDEALIGQPGKVWTRLIHLARTLEIERDEARERLALVEPVIQAARDLLNVEIPDTETSNKSRAEIELEVTDPLVIALGDAVAAFAATRASGAEGS